MANYKHDQFSFRLSAHLRDLIEEQAAAQNTSVSEAVRRLLIMAIDDPATTPEAARAAAEAHRLTITVIETPDGRFRVRPIGGNQYAVDAVDPQEGDR